MSIMLSAREMRVRQLWKSAEISGDDLRSALSRIEALVLSCLAWQTTNISTWCLPGQWLAIERYLTDLDYAVSNVETSSGRTHFRISWAQP